MDLNEFTSANESQRSGDAFDADGGALDAKPKPKRVKKTIDQQIAETEERLKKLKAKQRNEERAKRNHRLIASAATIEAEAGHVELDERIAAWLGRILANEIANRPDGEIARYIEQRDSKGGDR